jgi:rubrerythrin
LREEIIDLLKHLYELEKFQLSYYTSQLSSTEDGFYHKAFLTMAETENKHVGFFVAKLKDAGHELPKVGGTLAEIAGSILGESLELAGPANACKVGVALENKALLAYHQLLPEIKEDREFRDHLLEFLLEEEFHTLWLQDYAKRLAQKDRHPHLAGQTVDDHPTVNINLNLI